MKNKKIIFMGTADFSEAVLKMLIEEGHYISMVVTQPDRLVGRKKVLTPSLVKKLAIENNIKIFQPEKIRNDYNEIIKEEADLIITAAYGQIIPEIILNNPKFGCINVHASLLPRLRGGAPVHYAIINGDNETGVTIMYMAKKMDAGDIIRKASIPITSDETVSSLYSKLTDLGATLLKETLPSVLNGTNERIKQNEEEVTYAFTITREQEMIDWNKTAKEIDCFIRGMNAWPVASATYNGENIKIYAGQIHDCVNARKHHMDAKNGEIVKLFDDAVAVKVSDGIYLITEIQISGKKRMIVKQLLNGNKDYFKVGSCFSL